MKNIDHQKHLFLVLVSGQCQPREISQDVILLCRVSVELEEFTIGFGFFLGRLL